MVSGQYNLLSWVLENFGFMVVFNSRLTVDIGPIFFCFHSFMIHWDAHFQFGSDNAIEVVFLFYVFLLLAPIHNTMIQVWESSQNWDNTNTTQRKVPLRTSA